MYQLYLLLLHVHLQVSNTILHGSCTDRLYGLLADFRNFSCLFCAYPERFLHGHKKCVCFLSSKIFYTFNKLL